MKAQRSKEKSRIKIKDESEQITRNEEKKNGGADDKGKEKEEQS